METRLPVDAELIQRALDVSGYRTKRAVVTPALRQFIARYAQKRLLELVGKLEWDDSFEYKTERSRSQIIH